jgi:acyl-CoA thioesterase FadM
MTKVTLSLPDHFSFRTSLRVRITDINYGGHAGNDAILGMIHEARLAYLDSLGYSELDCGGVGLIMRDVVLQFKAELFRGDQLQISVTAADLGRSGFTLYYKVEKETHDGWISAVWASTGMVCFDYNSRKVVSLPDAVREKLSPG